MVNDAAAPDTPELSVPVPKTVVPSSNVTVPVGVPPVLLTVAVNVTDCPGAAGAAEEVRKVQVSSEEIWPTLWVNEALLLWKLLSPP